LIRKGKNETIIAGLSRANRSSQAAQVCQGFCVQLQLKRSAIMAEWMPTLHQNCAFASVKTRLEGKIP
jgi:hypothetical protein